MFVVQAQVAEFDAPKLKWKSRAWWHVFVILELERQKQRISLSSLVSQSSITENFQANERPCFNKMNGLFDD